MVYGLVQVGDERHAGPDQRRLSEAGTDCKVSRDSALLVVARVVNSSCNSAAQPMQNSLASFAQVLSAAGRLPGIPPFRERRCLGLCGRRVSQNAVYV